MATAEIEVSVPESAPSESPHYEPVLDLPPLPPEQFEALRSNIRANGVLVPILVDGSGPLRRVIDGNHRRKIADELAIECPEIARKGLNDQELRSLARALNLARRQLSQGEKREIIADQLRETPGRSNRWIARQLGVDGKTVSSVRKGLQASAELPQLDRTEGADGKTRPAIRRSEHAGPKNGSVSVDGTIPSPYSEKRIAAPPAPKSVILGSNDGRVSVSLGSLIADASPDDHQEVLDLDERAILRAAKEIRQRQIGEWRSRQRDREEQARSRLEGEQEWRVTGDQGVVECQLVISDPPYGITSEPWEPADIESFTRDWCGRWSACGADFFAVFWSQVRLFEGKQWFDESLKGYEFQQLLTWHAPNNNAHNSRQRFKETWEPIFLYRRHGSDRMIFKQDKPWGNGLLSHDCHVAPVPEGNYKGVDCKVHPCQKPLSVMRWLVYALTEPGEMVASPFAGVAPCGVAATQLGRKYHGIEIDDDCRRLAEGRIAMYGADKR